MMIWLIDLDYLISENKKIFKDELEYFPYYFETSDTVTWWRLNQSTLCVRSWWRFISADEEVIAWLRIWAFRTWKRGWCWFWAHWFPLLLTLWVGWYFIFLAIQIGRCGLSFPTCFWVFYFWRFRTALIHYWLWEWIRRPIFVWFA
jgi:hypothetical protein